MKIDPLLQSLGNKPRTGRVIKCGYCKKRFYISPSRFGKQKYCSVQCADRDKIKGKDLVCCICGQEYHRPPAQIKWRGSSCCSYECRYLYQRTQSGEKNKSWQGGKSTIYKRLRSGAAFKEWRTAVFERDNYTCQDCGKRSQSGLAVYLHPHHIKSFTHYPDLRFEVSNGITFCSECHKRHNFWQRLGGQIGVKNNTRG